MQQKVSEDEIKTLMEMKLAERKFGRFRLTSLGKIVSLV
jgi:predicted transcriptional regulator